MSAHWTSDALEIAVFVSGEVGQAPVLSGST